MKQTQKNPPLNQSLCVGETQPGHNPVKMLLLLLVLLVLMVAAAAVACSLV